MNPERQIDVEWNMESKETYPVNIRVNASDRVGLLAEVVACISRFGANILSASTQTREGKRVDANFTIDVHGTDHLNNILDAIKKVRQVQGVKRIR